MGIYDREYYRDDTGGGWFSGVAPVVKTLILINVGVFIAQVLTGPGLRDLLAIRSPQLIEGFEVWRLITAPFLHSTSDILHIVFNMLFLWWVGREIESMYGSREFLVMYLSAAVFSTFCWALFDYYWVHGGRPMLGASGAVTAVVVLYTLYYPRREVLLFFIIPMQMWLLLVIFLGFDLLSLLQGGGANSGTAYVAHLAGAAYGFCFKQFDLRWSRLTQKRKFRPKLRLVLPDRDHSSSRGGGRSSSGPARHAPNVSYPDEQFDARLDEILAKIARDGRDGLTEEEKGILQEASRRARDRRSGV